MADRSLGARDVARASGDATDNPSNVPANNCIEELVTLDGGTDMRNDVIIMTAEDTWPNDLVFSTENSNSPGFVRLNICNPTAAAVDPPSTVFHWAAFDVTP